MQDRLSGQACQAGAEYIKHRQYLVLSLWELWGGEISACGENKPKFAPTSLLTPARLRQAQAGAGNVLDVSKLNNLASRRGCINSTELADNY